MFLPRTSWITMEAGANFTLPLEHFTEHIVLGEWLSLVEKLGVVCKEYLNWLMFLSIEKSIVSRYSSICNLVHFSLTIFQLLTMTLLLSQKRNSAKCRMGIGYWLRNLATQCVSQFLSDVEGRVSSSRTTSRWCQCPVSPYSAFAVSTR